MGNAMSLVTNILFKAARYARAAKPWHGLTRAAGRLSSDNRGAVIIIIGLAIIPLSLALGLVIDSVRGYTAHNRLQGAVDAAALAGANSTENEEESIEDAATMYFESNYADEYLGGSLVDFDAVFNEDSGEINVTAEVLLPTTFMRVAGQDDITIEATASAITQTSGLELALVVDVTGSMDDTVGGVKKIDSLKTAATSLLDTLYGEADEVEDLFVSLVPYAPAVNIGSDRTNFVTGLSQGSFSPATWGGCIEARGDGLDQTDDPPTGSDGKFAPYNVNILNDDIGSNLDPNTACPPHRVTSLTPTRTDIQDEIDALTTTGSTLTNLGLVWGWRTVSPNWRGFWRDDTPAERPLDYEDVDNVKAVVFLTDGLAVVQIYSAYGLRSDGRLGSTNSSIAAQEVNNRLQTVCESMKAQDIIIFTIMFDLNNPTVESLYRDCATSDEHFFDSPTGEDLDVAFRKIGRQLTNLRLTQ